MIYSSYFVDVETTGTRPEKHDIIEICLWRSTDLESRTWWMQPLNPENIEQEALNINKHKREDILHQTKEGREKYLHPSIIIPEIEMWMMEDGAAAEDRFFIGQNPMFDYDFMLAAWAKINSSDSFPFGYWMDERNGGRRNVGNIIDTIQLARLIDLCTGKKRDRYGLGALIKAFGVTKAQAHRADGDVKMTKELFEKIVAVLKGPICEAFMNSY
jgi:DNA polymerase III epsilon subunit-like protein